MNQPRPARPKARGHALMALLVLFIAAALLAFLSRLLPRGLSGDLKQRLRRAGRAGSAGREA